MNVSGAFVHAEVRDPVLLGWPKEALLELGDGCGEVYRKVARKYGLDVAQNGSGFQVKSSTAIEAEVVESGAVNE